MANKKEIRQLDNLPTKGKMSSISATSKEGKLNYWEVEDRTSHRWRKRRSKPKKNDH